MRSNHPLPLLVLSYLLAISIFFGISPEICSLSLSDVFLLSISGPEGPIEKAPSVLDYSYAAEISTGYNTNQNSSSLDLRAQGRYKSLNINSTFNVLNKSLIANLILPFSPCKPIQPQKSLTDPMLNLRSTVTRLFFALIEAEETLISGELSFHLAEETYSAAKIAFERGEISFKSFQNTLDAKHAAEKSLQLLKQNLAEYKEDLEYLTDLDDLPMLSYDYSLVFSFLKTLPLSKTEYQLLDYPVLLGEYEIALAKHELYPKLNFDATLNCHSNQKPLLYAGISMQYTLFDSSQKAKLTNAKTNLTAAKTERDKNLRDLNKQKNRLLSEYNNAVSALALAQKTLTETAEFLDLATNAFQIGLISELDLKKARLSYKLSQNDFHKAHHNCFRLKLAVDGLITYQSSGLNPL